MAYATCVHPVGLSTLTQNGCRLHDMALMTFTGYLAEGELLMEYAGEVIRRPLADNRERQYASQGLGLYFFAVDRDHCIDATHQGNIARYINHSCR